MTIGKDETVTETMMKVHDLVGRGLVGFPNSEILAVNPGEDDWAGNGVIWYLTLQTADDRTLTISKTIKAYGDPTHGTYAIKEG